MTSFILHTEGEVRYVTVYVHSLTCCVT